MIDFSDVENPREVARWQVENPLARTFEIPGEGSFSGGRYLHDVQVVDGLAYLAYWKDGLVILDVGNGIKAGSPGSPELVSQLRFNHHELYEGDVLVMGYYNGGGRVLDVSGELRGNLYAQGREIGRLWTGDPEGVHPNVPLAWGAQPHGDNIYFNDINAGVWITRLGDPRDIGSTTAPPE